MTIRHIDNICFADNNDLMAGSNSKLQDQELTDDVYGIETSSDEQNDGQHLQTRDLQEQSTTREQL